MTLEEFLTSFEQHANKKKWQIKNGIYNTRLIRSEDHECPLCFIDNQVNRGGQIITRFFPPGTINMDSKDIAIILRAADNSGFGDGEADEIRIRLLKACGLTS